MNKPRVFTFDGITNTKGGWAESTGLSLNAVNHRLKDGWSIRDALTLPKYAIRPDKPRTPRVRKTKAMSEYELIAEALKTYVHEHRVASRRLVHSLTQLTQSTHQTSRLHSLMRDSIGEPDPSVFKGPGVVSNSLFDRSDRTLSTAQDRT